MRYFFWIAGILLVAYVLTGFTVVKPGERAVVRRFGRVLDDKPGPGLYIGLPWGMDRVDRIRVDKARHVSIGYQSGPVDADAPTTPPGQFLTGDHNLVVASAVITYKVDEKHVEDYLEQADRADDIVARAAESVLAEWLAGRNVDDVLTSRKLDLAQRLIDETQKRVAECRLGVLIQKASITDMAAPKDVKPFFDEVNQAKAAKDTMENEATKYAGRAVRDAKVRASDLGRQADVYRENLRDKNGKEVALFEQRRADFVKSGRASDHLDTLLKEEVKELSATVAKNGGNKPLSTAIKEFTVVLPAWFKKN